MRSMAEGGREGVGCGSPKVEWHKGEWKNPFPTQEMELQEKPGLCLGSPEQILIQEQQCCLPQQGLGSREERKVTIFLQSLKCVHLGEKH